MAVPTKYTDAIQGIIDNGNKLRTDPRGYGTGELVCDSFVNACLASWPYDIPGYTDHSPGSMVGSWEVFAIGDLSKAKDYWPGDIFYHARRADENAAHVAIMLDDGIGEAAGAGPIEPPGPSFYDEDLPRYNGRYQYTTTQVLDYIEYWKYDEDGKYCGKTESWNDAYYWEKAVSGRRLEEHKYYKNKHTYKTDDLTTYKPVAGDLGGEKKFGGSPGSRFDIFMRCWKAWEGIDYFEVPTGSGTKYDSIPI